MSVWGVSLVAILDSSVNCVCMWSTKKLTMLAYCVAANCNNSQITPGITMHELPHNQPIVRRKWIKFIQFKQADFLAAPHHTHLCSEHFSECDFANPMEYHMGFASKLTRRSGTLSKSCLTGSNWYGCRECLFTCIYNPQITVSPTSFFSVSFNGNRVKNHH